MIYQNLHDVNSLFYNGHEITQVICNNHILFESSQTITGVPPLTLTARKTDLVTSYTLTGNIAQNGMPIPDNPIEILGVGDRTVNLFDITKVSSPFIVSGDTIIKGKTANDMDIFTGLSGASTDLSYKSMILDAGVYTLSYVNPEGTGLVTIVTCAYTSATMAVETTYSQCKSGFSFTLSEKSYVSLRVAPTRLVAISKLAVVLSPTAIPYEPYGYKIPISSAGQTTPVYLGQTQTMRRIKKRVFDGTESWNLSSAGGRTRVFTQSVSECMSLSPAICTHFDYNVANVGYPEIGEFVINSTKAIIFGVDGNTFADVDTWKAYLASEYAAGTPVTVWYVLATPETGIVNEPLMKIGDYADELRSSEQTPPLMLTKGMNVIDIDTEVKPSSMSIIYK